MGFVTDENIKKEKVKKEEVIEPEFTFRLNCEKFTMDGLYDARILIKNGGSFINYYDNLENKTVKITPSENIFARITFPSLLSDGSVEFVDGKKGKELSDLTYNKKQLPEALKLASILEDNGMLVCIPKESYSNTYVCSADANVCFQVCDNAVKFVYFDNLFVITPEDVASVSISKDCVSFNNTMGETKKIDDAYLCVTLKKKLLQDVTFGLVSQLSKAGFKVVQR